MEKFLECKNNQLLNSSKPSELSRAWNLVFEWAKDRWPAMNWSSGTKSIRDKYNIERKRFRLWKTLVESSGVELCPLTSLPQATEEKWKEFLSRNSNAKWLKTRPLGNVEIYRELFWQESGTGDHFREPDDMAYSDEEDEPAPPPRPRSGRPRAADFNPGLKDTDSVLEEEVLAGPASWSTTPSRASSLQRGRRSKPEDPLVTLGKILASAMWKQPGNDDSDQSGGRRSKEEVEADIILKALNDFVSNFSAGIESSRRNAVFLRLQDLRMAAIWNGANTKDMKQILIESWTSN